MISDKNYKQEISLKEDSCYNRKIDDDLQKKFTHDLIEISSKPSKDYYNSYDVIREKYVKGFEDESKSSESKLALDESKKPFAILRRKTIMHTKNLVSNLRRNSIIITKNIFGKFWDIIVTPKYFSMYLKFLPLYIAINVIYYGSLFNIEKISTDIYTGTFMIFGSEFIGQIITLIVLPTSERKKLLYISLFINGALYFIAIFTENMFIRYLVVCGGSITITIAFIVIYTFAAETLDVEIKSTLTSLLSNSTCLFMMLFPFLLEIIPNIFVVFSFITFFSITMIGYFDETYKAVGIN